MVLDVKRGDQGCFGYVCNPAGSGSYGISIWEVAAGSENIMLRRVSALKWNSWRRWVRWPFIAVMRFPAAAMMALAGVAVGFERYLFLWKTVADTQVAQVFIIQIFHAR